MNNPRVSVIISTFNRPQYIKYLKSAIESVLCQSFGDFELFVIDDGSPTDYVGAVVGSFNDPRIIFIKNEKNLGCAVNTTKCINLARGEFIAILDDDDLWIDKDKLFKQVEFLDKNPEVVFLGTNAVIVDYSDNVMSKTNLSTEDQRIRRETILNGGEAYIHPSVMYRKKAAIEAGGYDNSFKRCEDYDFFLKMGQLGKFANLPEYAVKFRNFAYNQGKHTFKHRNIFLVRAKTCFYVLKTIQKHGKNYPYSVKVIIRFFYRWLLFGMLFIITKPFVHKIPDFKKPTWKKSKSA